MAVQKMAVPDREAGPSSRQKLPAMEKEMRQVMQQRPMLPQAMLLAMPWGRLLWSCHFRGYFRTTRDRAREPLAACWKKLVETAQATLWAMLQQVGPTLPLGEVLTLQEISLLRLHSVMPLAWPQATLIWSSLDCCQMREGPYRERDHA